MDSKTHITVEIDFPCRLSFSERIKVRKAAIDGAIEKLIDIHDEQRKFVVKQMREMVMNRFNLKASEAESIVEYVLNISSTYNYVINKLRLIEEMRDCENV